VFLKNRPDRVSGPPSLLSSRYRGGGGGEALYPVQLIKITIKNKSGHSVDFIVKFVINILKMDYKTYVIVVAFVVVNL
jgi:hypothetical protein